MAAATRPPRKFGLKSRKVRCTLAATAFPVLAAAYWAWTGSVVPVSLVYAMMAPWILLGGGEQGADLVKLHHEHRTGGA